VKAGNVMDAADRASWMPQDYEGGFARLVVAKLTSSPRVCRPQGCLLDVVEVTDT